MTIVRGGKTFDTAVTVMPARGVAAGIPGNQQDDQDDSGQ
jgi:hypothetical protein